MSRVSAVLAVLVLLVVLAVPAGAGPRNVTNPMTADLDAGGYSVGNAYSVTAQHGAITNTAGQVGIATGTVNDTARGVAYFGDGGAPLFGYPSIRAGSFDPSADGEQADAASLFLRRVDSTHGELWFKTGGCDTCWAKVAGP